MTSRKKSRLFRQRRAHLARVYRRSRACVWVWRGGVCPLCRDFFFFFFFFFCTRLIIICLFLKLEKWLTYFVESLCGGGGVCLSCLFFFLFSFSSSSSSRKPLKTGACHHSKRTKPGKVMFCSWIPARLISD